MYTVFSANVRTRLYISTDYVILLLPERVDNTQYCLVVDCR